MPAWVYQNSLDAGTSIGTNDANNAMDSSSVVTNDDGSVLERLEGIKDRLAGVDGTANILGANDADNGFDSSTVARNKDGSIIERLEDITAELSGTAGIATWPAAAAAGNAVSIAEVIRYIEDALIGTAGVVTFPASAAPGNGVSLAEVLRAVYDNVSGIDGSTNVLGADDADNGFASTSVVANADGSVLERMEYLQTDNLALPRCVEKSDGAVLSGDDPLFDITGGPIEILSITGIVTTNIGAGTTNVKLQLDTTTPAATVELNAGAVDIDADAAGTSYRSINTTGVFTPVTAGFVLKANSFATNDTTYLAPIGQIVFNSDAARAGVIKWYLTYRPMSPNSRVAAAA